MVDAGRPATKVRTSAGKASTRAKSGTSRSRTSSAKKSGSAASSAGKSRPKTESAKRSRPKTASAKKSPSKTSGARKSSAKTSTAKKQGTAKAGATTTVQRPAARPSATRAGGNGVDVPLPVLTPHLKTVHVPTPGMSYVEDAGRTVAAYLPPPGRLAFYGGLGIAAVAGLLDWPVAAAIGIGTVVARRAVGRGGATRSRSRA